MVLVPPHHLLPLPPCGQSADLQARMPMQVRAWMEVLALLRSMKRRRRIPLSSLIIQEVGLSQEGSTGSDLQRAAEEAEVPKENELSSPAS